MDFGEPDVVLLQRQAQFLGDFVFGRRALQTLLEDGNGGFDVLGFLAAVTGCPIDAAQAVENGAADFVLGIGF